MFLVAVGKVVINADLILAARPGSQCKDTMDHSRCGIHNKQDEMGVKKSRRGLDVDGRGGWMGEDGPELSFGLGEEHTEKEGQQVDRCEPLSPSPFPFLSFVHLPKCCLSTCLSSGPLIRHSLTLLDKTMNQWASLALWRLFFCSLVCIAYFQRRIFSCCFLGFLAGTTKKKKKKRRNSETVPGI